MTIIAEIGTSIGRTTNDGPKITRTYRLGQYTVRVRVARDSYMTQSYAVAEVLTPALTWTNLCEQPPENFFEHAPTHGPKAAASQELLLKLADDLARRGARILRVPTE